MVERRPDKTEVNGSIPFTLTTKSVLGFVFMLENNKKSFWVPALEIFSQVSSWIVGPIIFALIVGKYLDGRFDTKPWIFLGFTGMAFIVSAYGIVKVVSKYMKNIK